MLLDAKKFKKEIEGLKSMPQKGGLNPLSSARIKTGILSAISGEPVASGRFALPEKRPNFIKYLGTVLIGLGLIGGSALAAEGSIPGDFLYPVKIAKEKVEVKIAVTASAKANIEARHAEERINELVKLESRLENKTADKNLERSADDDFSFATSTETSISATGTIVRATSSLNIKIEENIKIRAKQDAENQVKKAVEALNKVKERLEAGHKSEEAIEAIKNNIKRLEERAEERGLKFERKSNIINRSEINIPSQEESQGKRIKVELENGFYQKIESSAVGSPSTTRVRIETNSQINQNSDIQIKFESSRQEIKVNNTNTESNSSWEDLD